MVVGRRAIRVEDGSRWVGNRVADVYDARPEYPTRVVDEVAAWAPAHDARVADLGAGTGRLALPLAARGFRVTAIEPAEAMLARLRETASERRLDVA